MPAILVMGATGGLGGQVVEFLLRRVCAENIVALACDPAKLQSFAERGVEIRGGDYSDTDSLETRHLQGGKTAPRVGSGLH
jgi:NAD(P)H dehydrogenase (quinone)